MILLFFFFFFLLIIAIIINFLDMEHFHVREMSLHVEPLYPPNKSSKMRHTTNHHHQHNSINALNMNRNLNINNTNNTINLNNNITVNNTSNPTAPPIPNKPSFLVLWLFFVAKDGRAGDFPSYFFLFPLAF